MIQPTVGRVVWARVAGDPNDQQPMAATIAYVHSDMMVNLSVTNHTGHVSPFTSVPLVQDGGAEKPGIGMYCEWMPYQIGQARKGATDGAKVALNP